MSLIYCVTFRFRICKDQPITAIAAKFQNEIPVIYKLTQSLGRYPAQLTYLFKELLPRAKAPFPDHQSGNIECETSIRNAELCFFPCLPRVRDRRKYRADSKTKDPICTKRSSRHPSLLPGVFTLFCEHGELLVHAYIDFFLVLCSVLGICYGFEVMRVVESPNTAFVVLFERFKEGMACTYIHHYTNMYNYVCVQFL